MVINMDAFLRNTSKIMRNGNMSDILAFEYQLKHGLTMSETLALLYPEVLWVVTLKRVVSKSNSDRHMFDLWVLVNYTRDSATIEWKYRVMNDHDVDFIGVKINGKHAVNGKMHVSDAELKLTMEDKYFYDLPMLYFCICTGAKLQDFRRNSLISYSEIFKLFGSCIIAEGPSSGVIIRGITKDTQLLTRKKPTNMLEHPLLNMRHTELKNLTGMDKNNISEINGQFLNMVSSSEKNFRRKVNGICLQK
jgi:hypothetical protein